MLANSISCSSELFFGRFVEVIFFIILRIIFSQFLIELVYELILIESKQEVIEIIYRGHNCSVRTATSNYQDEFSWRRWTQRWR